MLKTLEQANETQCPQTMQPVGDKGMQVYSSPEVCSGCECMAWRWACGDTDKPTDERLGYCGLVGKPEVSS